MIVILNSAGAYAATSHFDLFSHLYSGATGFASPLHPGQQDALPPVHVAAFIHLSMAFTVHFFELSHL